MLRRSWMGLTPDQQPRLEAIEECCDRIAGETQRASHRVDGVTGGLAQVIMRAVISLRLTPICWALRVWMTSRQGISAHRAAMFCAPLVWGDINHVSAFRAASAAGVVEDLLVGAGW